MKQRHRARAWVLAAALGLSLAQTDAAAAPSAGPIPARSPGPALRDGEVGYQVQPGDTLYHLATLYFTSPRAIEPVRRLNRVANVHAMPAGQLLRIPRGLVRDEPTLARIESFSGEVSLRPERASPLAATTGAELREGTVIETGRRGFVSLRLADDSTVTIPSQSTVQVIRLRRLLINGAVEREFRALSGRIRAKVTPMTDPASTFRVGTPITVSAVRGTEFRVAYDAQGERALTEVEDGKVQFGLTPTPRAPGPANRTPASAPAAALLTPGFGAVARPGAVGGATALLAAPHLADADRAQTDPQLSFAIEPDPAAAGYRIQIGRDAGLLDGIDEASGPDPRFTLDGIPTGTYFVRVAALDANGAEGLGRTYAFDRVLNAVSGTVGAEGRRYRFKWTSVAAGQPQFRFRLLRKPDAGQPGITPPPGQTPIPPQIPAPIIDEPLGTATEVSVTNLRPGEYAWQVLSIVPFGSKLVSTWSAPQQFEVTGRR